MMQNIFLHHNALTCAMWQAQWLYTAAILTATLQHSTSCCNTLSLTSRHGTLPATGRTLHHEAKSLLQRKGTNCRDAREIHGAKKERESVTAQSQRRSVMVQSHCRNAKERASQRDAKTKRAAMQMRGHCNMMQKQREPQCNRKIIVLQCSLFLCHVTTLSLATQLVDLHCNAL